MHTQCGDETVWRLARRTRFHSRGFRTETRGPPALTELQRLAAQLGRVTPRRTTARVMRAHTSRMATGIVQAVTIEVSSRESVSGLLQLAPDAHTMYVLAHGAGAGMNHPFMAAIAAELAARGVSTLRYQFPYMERGSKRPDAPGICHATVRAAVASAARLAPDVPLIAGGKSFGGRMTSQAQAAAPLAAVRGLAFIGFPLHPPKQPSVARAKHLSDVHGPLLFLQGTRDELADLTLLEPVVTQLGKRATLTKIEGADHSFHVLARSGRKDGDVLRELAQAIADWAGPLPP